jgi:hypothetical protein
MGFRYFASVGRFADGMLLPETAMLRPRDRSAPCLTFLPKRERDEPHRQIPVKSAAKYLRVRIYSQKYLSWFLILIPIIAISHRSLLR